MSSSAWRVLLLFALSTASSAHAQAAAAKAYTPATGPCPSDFSLIRSSGSSSALSEGELSYVSARSQDVLPSAWKSYLSTVQASAEPQAPLPSYVADILNNANGMDRLAAPTLGIAWSGGSYRAALFGMGALNALDGRNASSVKAGTGGLLQAATYLAGESGGGWGVMSLAQANFPPIPELIFGSSATNDQENGGWNTQIDLLTPSANQTVDAEYVGELVLEIQGKREAGFPVTFNDFWSRALARHFLNGTNLENFFDTTVPHGAGLTFSGIAELPSFASHNQPFPIILADLLSPNGNKSNIITAEGELIPLTNPILEFNVFEWGSFDPDLSAFAPTQFMGTTNTSVCVTGYDQSAFIAGVSSSLFNELNTTQQALMSSIIGPILTIFNTSFPQPGVELDAARIPNTFFGSKGFLDANQMALNTVDPGEDGEKLPMQPLLVKSREVDVIFAIDASADTPDNFAAGLALIASQNRTSFFPNVYSFPTVPTSPDTFIAQNLTTRPTFFGCDDSTDAPLLIYFANGGPPPGQVAVTNASTNQLSFPSSEVQAILDQTFTLATRDGDWSTCLACAVVDRARERSGVERSGACVDCFKEFCFEP